MEGELLVLARLIIAVLCSLALTATTMPREAHASGVGADGYYYSDADIEAIIEAAFDYEDWPAAKSVAWCESAYQPQAYNPAYDTVGIFQLSYLARVHYGLSYYDVDTPAENAWAANMIYQDQGWSPWECAY